MLKNARCRVILNVTWHVPSIEPGVDDHSSQQPMVSPIPAVSFVEIYSIICEKSMLEIFRPNSDRLNMRQMHVHVGLAIDLIEGSEQYHNLDHRE